MNYLYTRPTIPFKLECETTNAKSDLVLKISNMYNHIEESDGVDDKINYRFRQLIFVYIGLLIALFVEGGIEGAMIQMWENDEKADIFDTTFTCLHALVGAILIF